MARSAPPPPSPLPLPPQRALSCHRRLPVSLSAQPGSTILHPTLPPRHEKYFLGTLAGIQFSHILDFMIMMPLGPILMQHLGIDTREFAVLVASYSFSAALSGLLATTFVDRFERKRLLLSLFALFGGATLACGLAPGFTTLLLARSLTGAFGGIMGALVQTMLGDVIPFARRATASGTLSSAFALSSVAGVPLSLWLATHIQWRAPFLFIFLLTVLFLSCGVRFLPELRRHLLDRPPAHPLTALLAVLRDANHLRALLYAALILFSGFTVIPYITIYAVNNLAISQQEIPIVYLCGGAATLFTSRWIGRWADRRGKVAVYRRVALGATLPLLVVTHLDTASLPLWILCTSTFFVLISGRMVPAITIIVSAAQPGLRGTFMSLHATVQSLSMGLATTLAGSIITQDATTGRITGYPAVGAVALGANLLAIWLVGRIVTHDQPRS
ncbi:MAG: MFS transporter [Magnetococcales bacterium]|nr:MFS transporter [Magnetococcales bacterium]